MLLSDLLNRRVITESGHRLGRVHDIRAELTAGHLRITGLNVGTLGILERYGIGTRGSGGAGQAKVHGHPTIPWQHVVHVGKHVIVRDDPARPPA